MNISNVACNQGASGERLIYAPMSEPEKDEYAKKFKNLESMIATWVRIAEFNQVDISREKARFDSLQCDVKRYRSLSSGYSEAMTIRTIYQLKTHLGSHIMRKVRGSLRCQVPDRKITELSEKVSCFFDQFYRPLIRWAIDQKVEMSKECVELSFMIVGISELLANAQTNFQKKIILRRSFFAQQMIGVILNLNYIRSKYSKKIDQLAEEMKNKHPFEEKWCDEIENIRIVAKERLERSPTIQSIRRLFALYEWNLDLFANNPKQYYKFAEYEAVMVQINETAMSLKDQFPEREDQVEQLRDRALTLIEGEGITDDLIQRMNAALDAFVAGSHLPLSHRCGFEEL